MGAINNLILGHIYKENQNMNKNEFLCRRVYSGSGWEMCVRPTIENPLPISDDEVQFCRKYLDEKFDKSRLGLPTVANRQSQSKSGLHIYEPQKLQRPLFDLEEKKKQTGLFYHLGRRVSIWIRNTLNLLRPSGK